MNPRGRLTADPTASDSGESAAQAGFAIQPADRRSANIRAVSPTHSGSAYARRKYAAGRPASADPSPRHGWSSAGCHSDPKPVVRRPAALAAGRHETRGEPAAAAE